VVDKVLKYLKTSKIDPKDIQTKRVGLSQQRDYRENRDYYRATQNISITLRDLSRHETVMSELVKVGVNRIDGITYGFS